MQEGLWINYSTGRQFDVHEHESWLRESGNARKLGVPPNVVNMFGRFTPVKDRDKFLLFVIQNAPVMRVRGHGASVSFEFASHSRNDPMDAIWMWGKQNAGPFTTLEINNFATRESVSMMYADFEQTMDRDGPSGVMRAASTMNLRRRIARELLSLSKNILIL